MRRFLASVRKLAPFIGIRFIGGLEGFIGGPKVGPKGSEVGLGVFDRREVLEPRSCQVKN